VAVDLPGILSNQGLHRVGRVGSVTIADEAIVSLEAVYVYAFRMRVGAVHVTRHMVGVERNIERDALGFDNLHCVLGLLRMKNASAVERMHAGL